MFIRILVGLIGIPSGIAITKYAMQIKDNFVGEIYWAEKHLGRGGSYTLIKIIGIVVAILCFLYMMGSLQETIFNFFAPLSGKAPIVQQ